MFDSNLKKRLEALEDQVFKLQQEDKRLNHRLEQVEMVPVPTPGSIFSILGGGGTDQRRHRLQEVLTHLMTAVGVRSKAAQAQGLETVQPVLQGVYTGGRFEMPIHKAKRTKCPKR